MEMIEGKFLHYLIYADALLYAHIRRDRLPNYHSAIKSGQESITIPQEDLHFRFRNLKLIVQKNKTGKKPLTVATMPPYISISFIIAAKGP